MQIFFKAGLLARLEDLRDEALSIVITKFQCACRGYLALCDYKRRLDGVYALLCARACISFTFRPRLAVLSLLSRAMCALGAPCAHGRGSTSSLA